MLELPGTWVTTKPDERLRLSISGALYPMHCIKPGSGGGSTKTPIMLAEVITLAFATTRRFRRSRRSVRPKRLS